MQLLKKVANRVITGQDVSWQMDVERFDWNPGVFLAGVAFAYHKQPDDALLSFMQAWAERHMADAYAQTTVNSTAPLLMILELFRITGDVRYRKVCDDIAEWMVTQAPLTRDGGLEHTVTEKEVFSDQMWADTLFMAVLFLAAYGAHTRQMKYSDFAAKQLVLHHKLLKDEETGLFFHGWDGAAGNHMSAVRWARANAWITLSTPFILQLLPTEFAGRDTLLCSFCAQAEALMRCQRADGSFGTVLNRADAYAETSAVAGIAAGIQLAQNMGILDDSFTNLVQAAKQYVISRITADGEVCGVSGGTPVLKSEEDYLRVDVGVTLYGQGLTLFMLAM